MSHRPRVLLWCLLAGCAGGPISDFPKGDRSSESSNSGKPPLFGGSKEDGDGQKPPILPPTDADENDDLSSDGASGFVQPSDAGTQPGRPCASDPNGPSDAGVPDGGVCEGDSCPVTRASLDALVPAGACRAAAEKSLVCDAQVQRVIGRCNEQSLNDSASFDLVENCALTDPALSSVGEDCIDCYLDANRCTLLNCLAECLTPGADEACRLCRANQCGAALSACTGLPLL